MLTKLATFRGVSPAGEPLVRLFEPHSPLIKEAGALMPQIKDWMREYKPQDGKIAVLVNAMGASEFWGQNVNGDIFPEAALIHDCRTHKDQQHPYDEHTGKVIPPYGYWTFLNAYPFVHHRNKDPSRAFGHVALAVWNPRMHRVELIVIIDKALAMQHGAQDVVDRILAGEFPDVSMGCRVPYDVCTICGNKSKTRNDYCSCIKNIGMNKILEDGRRIGVINCHPRFFDISFVFIGADKTAKVMCKLASGLVVPQSIADADFLYGVETDSPEDGLLKAASVTEDVGKGTLAGGLGGALGYGAMELVKSKGKVTPEVLKGMARAAGEWGIAGGTTTGVLSSLPKAKIAAKTSIKKDISEGVLAGAVGGLASVGLMSLLKTRGKFSKEIFKAVVRAASEGGVAGGAGAGVVSALRKQSAAIPNFVTSDVEDARFPDTKKVRKMLAHAVAEKELGRTETGSEVSDKVAGIKDLKALKGLFENGAAKHLKTRLGRRSIRVDNLLKTSADRDPTDDADTRMIMGRVDNQESASVVEDGILRTNIGTRDEEDAANVDRSSGLSQLDAQNRRAAITNFYRRRLVGENPLPPGNVEQRPKVMGYYAKPAPANVWTADHSDSANLSKESTGLNETFDRAKAIKIGPPPERNRKEYPFVGTIEFRGVTIHVENAPGSVREGTGWRTEMKLPYGEILGSRGTDGDKLDVYVGPWRDAENVYIVHQNHVSGPREGKYDEDKVMLGFESAEQAKAAYLAHYSNPKFFRSITAMAFPLFKRAILSKEAHGEKLASAWAGVVANLVMEDEFSVHSGGEGVVKVAASLDELFSGASTARRRQRMWKDETTGKAVKVTGSGMENVEHTKTASVDIATMKVARVLHEGWAPEDILKVSNETKAAAHLKWADIVKRIGPSKAVGRVSPILSETEPDLPIEVLNKLGEEADLEKSLATPALMGMVLKPREFQRIILIHIGKGDLADKMDKSDQVFKPSEDSAPPCESLDAGHFDKNLLETLLPFLEGKSYTGPVVRRRIVRITLIKPTSHQASTEVDSPLLSKVASAYTWYRREIMKLARELPATVTSHPELHARTLGVGTEDLFSKTAAGDLGLDRRSVALLLGTVPLSLIYSAHKRRQMERGEDIGLLATLIAEHPWLTSMGTVTGLGALLRNPKAQQLVDELFEAGGRVWRGKQAPVNA